MSALEEKVVSLPVLSEHNVQTVVGFESPQSPAALKLTSPPVTSSLPSLFSLFLFPFPFSPELKH